MAGFLSGLFESKATRETSPKASEAIVRATGSSTAGYYTGVGLGPAGPWDIDQAVRNGVERVTWIFRCVDVIAQKQSVLPIKLRSGYDRENGEEVEDERLYRLLNFKANPYERAQQFRYRLSAILLLSRRGAFIEVVNGRDGRPSELHLLPPGSTRPIPDPVHFVSEYEITRGDGAIERLEANRVIWIRIKPHPTDPYAQLTPLMSAGITAETDWLAHIFNRNFLANDGRPGMLITVKGQMNHEDALELKRRFGGGPGSAGQTTVIEAEDINIADTSATPRDAQFNELLNLGKNEILLAFGVPESIMGNASGRTYDNADAERENFYVDTEVPHCDGIAQGLDALTGDLNDDVILAYDYSGIDVLQRAAARKREEWRSEIAAGVKTIDDYFELTGKERWNVLATKLLWHPSGIAIAPTPEEQAEIAKLRPVGNPPEPGMAPAGPGGPTPIDAGRAMMRSFDNTVAARALQLAGKEDRPVLQIESPTAARRGVSGMSFRRGRTPHVERKSLTSSDADDSDHDRERVEGLIEGLLVGWDTRQADVIPDRLMHVKSRKGTRHWDGDQETKALRSLDPSYSVDTDRWVGEMESAVRNILMRTIRREANKAAREMEAAGILTRIERERLRPVGGRTLERLFGGKDHLAGAMNRVLADNLAIMNGATRNQMRRVENRIRDLDTEGGSIREMESEIRRMLGQRAQWRKTLSVNVTTAAIEGAKEAVYSQGSRFMTKTWNAHADERTRPTHAAAHGQTVRGDGAFRVGGAFLRFPCDPLGPLHEIVQCRCWTTWAATPDTTWTVT